MAFKRAAFLLFFNRSAKIERLKVIKWNLFVLFFNIFHTFSASLLIKRNFCVMCTLQLVFFYPDDMSFLESSDV